ncbi:hypothetical protein AAFO92_03810 [Roseovarius sp. CAU 1744]|uniref:hypothetical protein n=1 Tax=Roseovarius sp. CAU 1744 TaxID=3140368 RepID=UPI00325BC855
MIEPEQFQVRVKALESQLQEKLGVRGSDLQKQLARAGRRLPRRVRRSGHVIADAQAAAAHPKLARLRDEKAIDAAFRDISAHLRTIDPADRRKGVVLGILGSAVFNLILLAAALTGFLYWQVFTG